MLIFVQKLLTLHSKNTKEVTDISTGITVDVCGVLLLEFMWCAVIRVYLVCCH